MSDKLQVNNIGEAEGYGSKVVLKGICNIAQNQSFVQTEIGCKKKVLKLSTSLSKFAIPWYKPIIAIFYRQ